LRQRIPGVELLEGDQVSHSKSLRAIGQSLEIAHIKAFELKKEGDVYLVRSDALTPTRQWILRNSLVGNVGDSPGADPKSTQSPGVGGWFCYDALDLSRLDAQGRKKRGNHSVAQIRGASTLSQLLRTVGEHLDRLAVSTFSLSWGTDSVAVEYQVPGEGREHRSFSLEKLQQLGSHMRFRRSNRSA
jgi:hypothetical protein